MRAFKYKRLFETETFDMTPIIDVVFLLILPLNSIRSRCRMRSSLLRPPMLKSKNAP
jgi:hypothetical protein